MHDARLVGRIDFFEVARAGRSRSEYGHGASLGDDTRHGDARAAEIELALGAR
jgi:hypothetical protein